MFTDYYFYLIGFKIGRPADKPTYFRVDRIRDLTVHRKNSDEEAFFGFDEGWLRDRSLFMWPGPLRTIRFTFSGPSVQAVLDKLPTAKIIDRTTGADGKPTYLIEAETFGDGIKMWLLSQGSWVKVISPESFVEEMKKEIHAMQARYTESD